jgi:hypothetical protein
MFWVGFVVGFILVPVLLILWFAISHFHSRMKKCDDCGHKVAQHTFIGECWGDGMGVETQPVCTCRKIFNEANSS